MDMRVEICHECIMLIENDPDFFKQVVTCDESWGHYFDPLTQRESLTWKSTTSPETKKVRQHASTGKVILIVFFIYRRVVYRHFVPLTVKVNVLYFCNVLTKLSDHITRKRLEKKNMWVLHNNNTHPHWVSIIKEFFMKKNPYYPHPLYSLELAPCDY